MTTEHWVLISIAAINALSAYFTWQTDANVKKVEVATNSMKDALVASTALASEAKGRDEERARGEARAKTLLRKDEK